MSMSPADLRHTKLRRRITGGYRKGQVDSLLKEVQSAYEEVWRDRADGIERQHELLAEIQRHRELEDMLRRTLMAAESSAADMRETARRDCQRILREAEQRAREIVGGAQLERERIRMETTA